MEKLEKVLKGFGCCVATVNAMNVKSCNHECPYFHEGLFCKNALHSDGKKIIQQLENKVKSLEVSIKMAQARHADTMDALAQVERERDAAVHDMENYAGYGAICKHFDNDCPHIVEGCPLWPSDCESYEWRGVCPENTKEALPCS